MSTKLKITLDTLNVKRGKFASKIGISRNHLYEIENARKGCSAEVAYKIEQALKGEITIYDILQLKPKNKLSPNN